VKQGALHNPQVLRKVAVLRRASLAATLALTVSVGCSGDDAADEGPAPGETPANVAGDYTVTLTNVHNDCETMADKWMDGAMSEGVPFSITQKGVHITAETMGASAIYFLALTGTIPFEGEIHGNHFLLINYGSRIYDYGACTYTINATVEGDIDGDTIAGTLVYSPDVAGNPDCEAYACQAEQTFTGTRPAP
jgi:hypothetical protein